MCQLKKKSVSEKPNRGKTHRIDAQLRSYFKRLLSWTQDIQSTKHLQLVINLEKKLSKKQN